MGKKFGFTLAETLITLGIIGVVAAMTIPTLISKYKEQVLINKLVETFSIISQAYKHAIEEKGDPSAWSDMTSAEGMYDANAHSGFANMVKPHLKLAYDCVGKSDEYTNKYCSPKEALSEREYALVRLINGTTVVFRVWSITCNSGYKVDNSIYRNNVCGQITVLLEPDKKKENGKNAFNFYATTDSIVPFGLKGSRLEFEKACDLNNKTPYPSFSSGNMYGCAAWVIQNRNMDYLHCPGELGWEKGVKCPRKK